MIRDRLSLRKAKRVYLLANLGREIEDLDARLTEIEAAKKAPCPACVERGWVAPGSRLP